MDISIEHENLSNTYILRYGNDTYKGLTDIKGVRDKIEEIEHGRKTGTDGCKTEKKEQV